MSFGIASDHGGFELKTYIKTQFKDLSIVDLGTDSEDSVHYPHFADVLCREIISGKMTQGILICGTGIGISMRANRFKGIRAAVVYDEFTATMAKVHNNANILCLGGRTTTKDMAILCIQAWLAASFEGGRHQHRIELLDEPTN